MGVGFANLPLTIQSASMHDFAPLSPGHHRLPATCQISSKAHTIDPYHRLHPRYSPNNEISGHPSFLLKASASFTASSTSSAAKVTTISSLKATILFPHYHSTRTARVISPNSLLTLSLPLPKQRLIRLLPSLHRHILRLLPSPLDRLIAYEICAAEVSAFEHICFR